MNYSFKRPKATRGYTTKAESGTKVLSSIKSSTKRLPFLRIRDNWLFKSLSGLIFRNINFESSNYELVIKSQHFLKDGCSNTPWLNVKLTEFCYRLFGDTKRAMV